MSLTKHYLLTMLRSYKNVILLDNFMIFETLAYFLPYILRPDSQSDGYFGKKISTNWQIWELKTIGEKIR